MEVDIYGDLDEFNNQFGAVQQENQELKKNIEKLQQTSIKFSIEVNELKRINCSLETNISSLYKTAKTELERKNKQIADLRKELEDLYFKRGSNKKGPPPNKNEDFNAKEVLFKKTQQDNETKNKIIKCLNAELENMRKELEEKKRSIPEDDSDNRYNKRFKLDRQTEFENENEYFRGRYETRDDRPFRSKYRKRGRGRGYNNDLRSRLEYKNNYHHNRFKSRDDKHFSNYGAQFSDEFEDSDYDRRRKFSRYTPEETFANDECHSPTTSTLIENYKSENIHNKSQSQGLFENRDRPVQYEQEYKLIRIDNEVPTYFSEKSDRDSRFIPSHTTENTNTPKTEHDSGIFFNSQTTESSCTSKTEVQSVMEEGELDNTKFNLSNSDDNFDIFDDLGQEPQPKKNKQEILEPKKELVIKLDTIVVEKYSSTELTPKNLKTNNKISEKTREDHSILCKETEITKTKSERESDKNKSKDKETSKDKIKSEKESSRSKDKHKSEKDTEKSKSKSEKVSTRNQSKSEKENEESKSKSKTETEKSKSKPEKETKEKSKSEDKKDKKSEMEKVGTRNHSKSEMEKEENKSKSKTENEKSKSKSEKEIKEKSKSEDKKDKKSEPERVSTINHSKSEMESDENKSKSKTENEKSKSKSEKETTTEKDKKSDSSKPKSKSEKTTKGKSEPKSDEKSNKTESKLREKKDETKSSKPREKNDKHKEKSKKHDIEILKENKTENEVKDTKISDLDSKSSTEIKSTSNITEIMTDKSRDKKNDDKQKESNKKQNFNISTENKTEKDTKLSVSDLKATEMKCAPNTSKTMESIPDLQDSNISLVLESIPSNSFKDITNEPSPVSNIQFVSLRSSAENKNSIIQFAPSHMPEIQTDKINPKPVEQKIVKEIKTFEKNMPEIEVNEEQTVVNKNSESSEIKTFHDSQQNVCNSSLNSSQGSVTSATAVSSITVSSKPPNRGRRRRCVISIT